MTEIYKVAKTRVQKLYEAGLLSDEAKNEVRKRPEVLDNLNNRINAKAQRRIDNLNLSDMNTKRYEGYSNINAVGSRAPIDAKRIMKRSGQFNSAIISNIRKGLPGGMEIKHMAVRPTKSVTSESLKSMKKIQYKPKKAVKVLGAGGQFHPGSMHSFVSKNPAELKKIVVVLPDKKNQYTHSGRTIEKSKDLAKERRALTAAHEIAGEAEAGFRINKVLKKKGFDVNKSTYGIFDFGSHKAPSVLDVENKLADKLHPAIKKEQKALRKASLSKLPGVRTTESDIMNLYKNDYSPSDIARQQKILTDIGNKKFSNSEALVSNIANSYLEEKPFRILDKNGNDITEKAFGVFKGKHKRNVSNSFTPKKKNVKKGTFNNIGNYVRKHPYQTAAAVAGGAATAYGAHKLYEHLKKQKENKDEA